jgi:hypothetical protein
VDGSREIVVDPERGWNTVRVASMTAGAGADSPAAGTMDVVVSVAVKVALDR